MSTAIQTRPKDPAPTGLPTCWYRAAPVGSGRSISELSRGPRLSAAFWLRAAFWLNAAFWAGAAGAVSFQRFSSSADAAKR